MEFLPSSKTTFIGTVLQMNNGLVVIYMALYFWFISRQWYWIELMVIGMTIVVIFCSLFFPESPKFLLSKQRWDEARAAITKISKINGHGVFTGKFDREPSQAAGRDINPNLNASMISRDEND